MNKEIVKKDNWYSKLIIDLKVYAFNKTVEIKHAIGKRILEDEEKFGKPEYGKKRIENLAKDLNGSLGEIYACIKFARKYPEISDGVRELSWREIEHKLLPEPKTEKEIQEKIEKQEKLIEEIKKAGKYQIIYADPAWSYYKGGHKNQNQHYDGMSIEEISNLPIKDLADENCILFLWVTFPILPDSFRVIESWGFKYSTVGFTWVKSKKDKTGFAFGLGNWTRANAEICLIATKGSIERKDASVSQIIYEPLEEHSKKPDIVREKIVQLVGDLPRIELFARNKAEGWDRWGLESPK